MLRRHHFPTVSVLTGGMEAWHHAGLPVSFQRHTPADPEAHSGAGPTSTLYGLEMMGAMMGHAVATGLAGLVLYVTGSFPLVLALSMAFSLVGMLVILHLESSAQVLIPH